MKSAYQLRGLLVVLAAVVVFEFLDFLKIRIPVEAAVLIMLVLSAALVNSLLDGILSVIVVFLYISHLILPPFRLLSNRILRYPYRDLSDILLLIIAVITASVVAYLLKRQLTVARAKLERDKAKDEAILSSLGEGVAAVNAAGEIIVINESGANMLGLTASKAVGCPFHQLFRFEDKRGRAIDRYKHPFYLALRHGKKVCFHPPDSLMLCRADDSRIALSLTVAPIVLAGKNTGAAMVFRDATEEQEIDRAKTEFVFLVSHQLKTPLTSVSWYTELLKEQEVGKLNTRQKEFLSEIEEGCRHTVELINALLNVSRIDLGTFAIQPVRTQVIEIADNVLHELSPQIRDKYLQVTKHYGPKLPQINVDAKLMHIILQNLLSNAVKYTPAGGRIHLVIEKGGKTLLIKVSDTGYGIPQKDQARIFTKLFRAGNVRVFEPDGNGLGLYLVKSILDRAGGKAWFTSPGEIAPRDLSEDNKGTTFYVSLPLSGMLKKVGFKRLS